MQLKGVEKKDIFTTFYYELTWAVSWDQIISFVDVIIKSDFIKGEIQSVEVGIIAGAKSIDVTQQLKEKSYNIKDTDFAKNESGFIIIAGFSSIMKVPMRITVWNQLDRFLLQIVGNKEIDENGEHCFDKYVDSIEIRGHMDFAKTNS